MPSLSINHILAKILRNPINNMSKFQDNCEINVVVFISIDLGILARSGGSEYLTDMDLQNDNGQHRDVPVRQYFPETWLNEEFNIRLVKWMNDIFSVKFF